MAFHLFVFKLVSVARMEKEKQQKKKIYIYIKIEKKKNSSVAGRMSVSSVTSFFLIYQVDPAL